MNEVNAIVLNISRDKCEDGGEMAKPTKHQRPKRKLVAPLIAVKHA